MKLKEFLEFFEFSYIEYDNYVRLVDLTEANLGGIELEEFPKDNLWMIVDRLEIYYKDYIFDDLAEEYGLDPDNWGKIYHRAKNHPLYHDVLMVIMGDQELTLK